MGHVYQLVDTNRRAWHCGRSEFKGRPDVNDYSIGVSFGNRNDGVEEYTELQYDIGAELCAALLSRYPHITIDRITTHAAIALPPGRKTDPGPQFDLDYFKALIQKERNLACFPSSSR